MNPSLALIVFIIGIAGLFFLDRERSLRPSKAVWLPVIWMWINGSRSVSSWLGLSSAAEASSLPDESVAGILMLLGVIVIVRRRRDAIALLRRSWPLVLYFSYCLLSIFWCDFPAQGLTRWVRAFGELVMVMVLATEAQPNLALRRLFSRVGFVLLPLSVLFVRYFPSLGRSYDEFGWQMNTGVTTNKNTLGVVTFVLALGTVWQILELLRAKRQPNRSRRLFAQCILLWFGISLLFTAHSATSGACFTFGAVFMVITVLPVFERRPAAVHAFVLAIFLAGGLTLLFGGKGAAAEAVGRDASFTGRTAVWEVLIPMAPNPIVGAGFENFWFGPRFENLRRTFTGVNEAHDGYLEVYLNLGVVGVGLIVLILINGYRRAAAAFQRNSALGSLLIAYVLTAAIYSATEAGFRMLDPIWFCLMLSVVLAGRIDAEEMAR
jgi:exopolysaccharide production protein ExoQ